MAKAIDWRRQVNINPSVRLKKFEGMVMVRQKKICPVHTHSLVLIDQQIRNINSHSGLRGIEGLGLV
jgi:hypothetical protein